MNTIDRARAKEQAELQNVEHAERELNAAVAKYADRPAHERDVFVGPLVLRLAGAQLAAKTATERRLSVEAMLSGAEYKAGIRQAFDEMLPALQQALQAGANAGAKDIDDAVQLLARGVRKIVESTETAVSDLQSITPLAWRGAVFSRITKNEAKFDIFSSVRNITAATRASIIESIAAALGPLNMREFDAYSGIALRESNVRDAVSDMSDRAVRYIALQLYSRAAMPPQVEATEQKKAVA